MLESVDVVLEHTILESLHEIRDGNKFVWAAAARKIRYSAVLLGASDGLLNAFWRNSKLARNCFHSNAALKLSNYFQTGSPENDVNFFCSNFAFLIPAAIPGFTWTSESRSLKK